MIDEPLESLVHASYGLATGEATLDLVGDLLARVMGYGSSLISVRSGISIVELATNLPAQLVQQYTSHYYRLDPWTYAMGSAPMGRPIYTNWEQMRARAEHTEFYQDFARPQGLINPLGIRLKLAPTLELQLGVNQRQQTGEPNAVETSRMTVIAQHLQRGLQLRERLGLLDGRLSLSHDLLDRLAFGVAVVDGASHIRFINREAERMMGNGWELRVRGGKLLADSSVHQNALAAAIADVMAGGAGGCFLLTRPTSGIVVQISRMPPALDRVRAATCALVVLSEPRRARAPSTELLRMLYHLTLAEAEVAASIAGGLTIERIAGLRDVKLSTVKSQLDTIFAKTETKSQRDLAQLLTRLPQLDSAISSSRT